MWIGVGVLLGLFVLSTALGFHLGPHGHVAAVVLGVAAAIWLLAMAASGNARPILWVLLGADVVISAGLGVFAWRGLKFEDEHLATHATPGLVGAEGVAVTDLEPDGIIRVRGENWSATSMNGSVPAGGRVQVIEATGVRLGVWSEEEPSAVDEGPHRLLSGHRRAPDGEHQGEP